MMYEENDKYMNNPGYPEVLKQAMETYHIEPTKMMRYARQRGREDELKKILEEIEDAEA
jgi:hypothetical protein